MHVLSLTPPAPGGVPVGSGAPADPRRRPGARWGWPLLLVLCPLLGPAPTIAAEPVTAVAVAEPASRTLTLSGFTRARARLPLVTETAGRVLAVAHDLGERVGDDGVFARIDDTFIRLELEQIQVQQQRLQAQIAYDAREAERYRKLAERDNAAAAQLDALEQTLINNRNEQQRLGVERRIAEERLRRTAVPAPPGWRITERRVELGQWVQAGEVLGAAADFRTLLVPFALSPAQADALRRLEAGGRLRLALPDLGETVPASIYRENPGFDTETRKIAVELRLNAAIEPARGGLRAELELALPAADGTVLLPAAAVRRSYEEARVQPIGGDPIPVQVLGQGPPAADGSVRLKVRAPGVAPGALFALPQD